ncbi:MAG: hypothetical protein ACON5N_04200 [Akkermansiaceae bacterium]
MAQIIFTLFLLVTCSTAFAEERKARSVGELGDLLEDATLELYEKKLGGREAEAFRRETMKDWTFAEVKSVIDSPAPLFDLLYEWDDALVAHWAFLDHSELASRFLKKNPEMKALMIEAGKGLEGNAAENICEHYWYELRALLSGWSRRDAKAAWKAIQPPHGKLSKLALLEGYGYAAPISIFEHLARADPEYAISEPLKHPDPMWQGSMLQGMVHGLPDDTHWKSLFKQVAQLKSAEHRDVYSPMRGSVLSRWLEKDPIAATRWFRSKEGEVFSMYFREVTVDGVGDDPFSDDYEAEKVIKVREEVSLANAARHWLTRDPEGAVKWIKNQPGLVGEIVKGGTWLDPDDVSRADLQMLLRTCLNRKEREELLENLVGKRALRQILPSEEGDDLEKEIDELNLDETFAKSLMKRRREEEADPFWD